MAAVNVAAVVTEIAAQIAPVVAVGLAVLSIAVAIVTFGRIKAMIMGGDYVHDDPNGFTSDPDEWEGYTAEDDARDREAAGL